MIGMGHLDRELYFQMEGGANEWGSIGEVRDSNRWVEDLEMDR